ncbi:MAG: type IX secretion system protein PorQ [Bacteroidia bacterium]
MFRRLIFLILISSPAVLFAQIGGTSTYQFLTVQPNARIAALGGYAIALPDNDLNLAIQNPSLLNKEMSNQVTYNYVSYVAGIGAGYTAIAHHFDSIGTFALGIQYINYGDFTKTSANGEILGTFRAGEYNIHVSYARMLNEKFSVGGAIKFINSTLEEYNSWGIAADLSGTYYDRKNLLTICGVISNYGRQIKTYRPDNYENLPLNFQLGISKKLLKAPLRFSLTANHLENPGGLMYQNPDKPGLTKDLTTGQVQLEDINFAKKTLSHLNASAEIILGKSFYVGFGYNYLRQWELKLDTYTGFAGFSWGFGVRIYKFQLAYGHTSYAVGYGTDHFSFIFKIDDFLKKKAAN